MAYLVEASPAAPGCGLDPGMTGMQTPMEGKWKGARNY